MLEIPQLCMWHRSLIQSYSGGPYKLWTGQCFNKKTKSAAFYPIWLYPNIFFLPPGLDWWDIDSLPCTFPTAFQSIWCSCCQLSKHLHLLEAKKAYTKVVEPTCSCHVNAVEGRNIHERLRYSLDLKCVDKCTYALITILPRFQGGVNTQVHKKTVDVFFWLVSRRNIHCVFLPSCPALAFPPLPFPLLSAHPEIAARIQSLAHPHKIHACGVSIHSSPLRLLSQK